MGSNSESCLCMGLVLNLDEERVLHALGEQWFDSTTHKGIRRFYKLTGDAKPAFMPIKQDINEWLELFYIGRHRHTAI
jgi:hypothetical protein